MLSIFMSILKGVYSVIGKVITTVISVVNAATTMHKTTLGIITPLS